MIFSLLRHQNERAKTYLGSPSLVRLPDGAIVASHDYFGKGCPRNHEAEEGLTSIYRSEDDGATWENVTHVMNSFWPNLFVHGGALYLFGTSQQYGSILIRKSEDGGFTWTHPADGKTGLLFAGGPYRQAPNYHCAPMPVVEHKGRLYRAFEDCDPCDWGTGFKSLVVSAPVGADLLDAASWTMSDKLAFDPAWVPAKWNKPTKPGWLEGNVVVDPQGSLVNILRFNSEPEVDKAALVRIAEGRDGSMKLSFDPSTGYLDFPGGMTKFSIRRDQSTGMYLTISNNNTDPKSCWQRNTLCLNVSEDLIHWKRAATLLADESGLPWEASIKLTGFQYVDWQFDGDDLIYLVRTAYRGAANFHDSNMITFHRLKKWREKTQM